MASRRLALLSGCVLCAHSLRVHHSPVRGTDRMMGIRTPRALAGTNSTLVLLADEMMRLSRANWGTHVARSTWYLRLSAPMSWTLCRLVRRVPPEEIASLCVDLEVTRA